MPSFSIWHALLAGIVITALDVGCTLLFAVRAWNAELARQGLQPSPRTPIYYISAHMIGGAVLTWLYAHLSSTLGPGARTALGVSFLLWLVTRIYGGGHVVMGQMPLRIFAIMSAGLGLGYVAAGQVVAFLAG